MSRTTNVPMYYGELFPEYPNETPEAFLRKHDPLLWHGIEKTPVTEQLIIIQRTQLLVLRKAELLKRQLGWYTTRKGVRYRQYEGGFVYIEATRNLKVYRIWYDTGIKRIVKAPDWYPKKETKAEG